MAFFKVYKKSSKSAKKIKSRLNFYGKFEGESADNFGVNTHCFVWNDARLDTRTNRQTDSYSQRSKKYRKKFLLDREKVMNDPTAIYVRRRSLSGHDKLLKKKIARELCT